MPDEIQTEGGPAPVVAAGRAGLRQYSGTVYEEIAPRLSGTRAARVFREMSDNSAIIGGIVYAIRSLLRGVGWRAIPSSETPQAVEVADFLEECMRDMRRTWSDFVSDALTMIVYGWAVLEITAKRRTAETSRFDDGQVGIADLSLRSQDTLDRWVFAPDNSTATALEQRCDDGFAATIPLDRCVHVRTESTRDNPEGRSLLRNAYRSWFLAKRIEEIEGIGIERELAGIPVMEVPPEIMGANASVEAQQAFADYQRIVERIRANEQTGLVLPSESGADGKPTGYRFRLLASGGTRAIDTDRVIRRYESRIAMSMLAEFLLLGTEPNGSRSLADSKTGMFAQSLAAILGNIRDACNAQLVPHLMRWNGIETDLWPTLEHGDLEERDIAAFAAAMTQLVGAGALVPTVEDERAARDILGLPQRGDGDEVLPHAVPEVAPA